MEWELYFCFLAVGISWGTTNALMEKYTKEKEAKYNERIKLLKE